MAKRRNTYRDDDYGFGYFPRSKPIKPADGIQSRSQRGQFAANWWAKRWLAVLESYGIDSRLQRGRSYARGGQVLNIDIKVGQVTAQVQGSRPKPYAVNILVKLLPDDEWERVLDAIGAQAIFAAQLLDGTMPQEIETAFTAAKVSLFPQSASELTTSCSCPDFANPCKHIAAVYYLLGEQFDRDPFLIFRLRGRTPDQILAGLRQRRTADHSAQQPSDAVSESASAPLTADLGRFWGDESWMWNAPDFAAPAVEAALLRRLGAAPGGIHQLLTALYAAVTAQVQTRIFGSDALSDTNAAPSPNNPRKGKRRAGTR